VRREKLLHGLVRPRAEVRPDRVAVDVGILDDEVAAARDVRGKERELRGDVRPAVVRVQDDEARLLGVRPANTEATRAGSALDPARYRRRGCTGRSGISRTSIVTTSPPPTRSSIWARKSALPPRWVPVSTTSAGRVSKRISWYAMRSVGHLRHGTPIQEVRWKTRPSPSGPA